MIREGLKMLQSALIMSWTLGPKVLLTSWFPVMLFFFFEMAYARAEAIMMIQSTTYYVITVGALIMQFRLLGALAVRLHRAALMPQGAAAVNLGRLQWAYIGHWLLLGMTLSLPLIIGSFVGFRELVYYVPTIYLTFVILALWFLVCVLFYRASMGLPHLACGQGRIPWRQSWKMTRPLAGQIVIATAAGLGALTALGTMSIPLYEYLPFLGALFDTILEVIIILIGASLMNVIYQNCSILQKA